MVRVHVAAVEETEEVSRILRVLREIMQFEANLLTQDSPIGEATVMVLEDTNGAFRSTPDRSLELHWLFRLLASRGVVDLPLVIIMTKNSHYHIPGAVNADDLQSVLGAKIREAMARAAPPAS